MGSGVRSGTLPPALLGCAALALWPLGVLYGGEVRTEPLVLFCDVLALAAWWRVLKQGGWGWALLAGLAWGWAAWSKPETLAWPVLATAALGWWGRRSTFPMWCWSTNTPTTGRSPPSRGSTSWWPRRWAIPILPPTTNGSSINSGRRGPPRWPSIRSPRPSGWRPICT
ncbi:MAG: hypothetical protein COX57_09800 [Alphaproteobacteria bacterium CG_4_10_14_0_2_um_filter_63_37]|nr:MAG: hypothetical protein COX57_09800 [Alphaproteobacteria bacterium CG_4_10_14_0_2_um_filter_63_37]